MSPWLPDAQKIARSICLRDHISDIETILAEFFTDTTEGYIHERCEREIKAMNEKSGKKSQRTGTLEKERCERNANAMRNDANASKTMRTHQIGCERNAKRMRTQCSQYPIPNTQYQRERRRGRACFLILTLGGFAMPMDWKPSRRTSEVRQRKDSRWKTFNAGNGIGASCRLQGRRLTPREKSAQNPNGAGRLLNGHNDA